MEQEEGGRRGEKKEESKEDTVRSLSVSPIQDQGPSEETKCTGKGKAEWDPRCEEGVNWLMFQDSHFSILTATFMVACEWLRP